MHIVAITGSLRKASCNTGVLRAMQAKLPPNTTMDIIVPDLPLFNQDIERPELIPASVVEFRSRLKAADCFIFSLCEYNFSLSGAAKNAIDWGSRGPDGNLFDDKAAAVVGAAGGAGGLRATNHFRDIALFLNLHVMNKPSMNTKIFEQPYRFNLENGDLIAPAEIEACGAVVNGLVQWTNRINLSK